MILNNFIFYINNNYINKNLIFIVNILNIKNIYVIIKYISCLSIKKKICIKNNICKNCQSFFKKNLFINKKNICSLSNIYLNYQNKIFFIKNININFYNFVKYYLIQKDKIKNIKKKFVIKVKKNNNLNILKFFFYAINYFIFFKINKKINFKIIYYFIFYLIRKYNLKFIKFLKFFLYIRFIYEKKAYINLLILIKLKNYF